MKTKILFANLLGLQVKDTQHSMALGQVFSQINKTDVNSFYDFCVNNKHKYEKETRGTRLVSLYNDFISHKNNSLLPHKEAKSFTDTLVEKLSYVINDVDFIQSNGFLTKDSKIAFEGVFSWDIYKDDNPFTRAEKNALFELGTVSFVIESYRTGAIKDDLVDLYMKKYLENKQKKSLDTVDKKAMDIINNHK